MPRRVRRPRRRARARGGAGRRRHRRPGAVGEDGRHPPGGLRGDRQPRSAAFVPAGRVEPDAALHPHAGHLQHRARRHRHAGPGSGDRPRHRVRGRPELDVHPPRGRAVRERPADHGAGRQVRHPAVVRLRRHRRRAHVRRRPAGRPREPLPGAVLDRGGRPGPGVGRDAGRPHDHLPAARPPAGPAVRDGPAVEQPGAGRGRQRRLLRKGPGLLRAVRHHLRGSGDRDPAGPQSALGRGDGHGPHGAARPGRRPHRPGRGGARPGPPGRVGRPGHDGRRRAGRHDRPARRRRGPPRPRTGWTT